MTITNKKGLTEGLVRALRHDSYSKGKADFSATELLVPSRIVALRRMHAGEIIEDASDLIYRLLGRTAHALVEISKSSLAGDNEELRALAIAEELDKYASGKTPVSELPDAIKNAISEADSHAVLSQYGVMYEERLFATVNINDREYTISGQIDDYDIAEGIITDYKLTSRFSILDGGKDEWNLQMQVYAWLLEKNGYTPKKARIEAILRDWSKLAAFRDLSYPQSQVVEVPFELWEPEKREAFVKERVSSHILALHTQDEEKIPVCTREERWEKAPTYAVKKAGRARALRVLDSKDEAKEWLLQHRKSGEILSIEDRVGESTRCRYYCDVKKFCTFGKYLAK